MAIISPSLLSCDFLNIQSEVDVFKNQKELWLHLDIMDGHFVPNLTFGPCVFGLLNKVTSLPLDAHFMVKNPENYIRPSIDAGIYNFTFHWEAVTHHDRLIQELKKDFKSIGISLNPSTPIEVIPDYLLKQINLVLIMSVNPGFGGQSFINGAIEKISHLAKRRSDLELDFLIQVDGGINEVTAKEVLKAGADNLVAGSFIFKNGPTEYLNNINKLRG